MKQNGKPSGAAMRCAAEMLHDKLGPQYGVIFDEGSVVEMANLIDRETGLKELIDALEALLERHVGLVISGDCGFWDVEIEESVIESRKALAKAKGIGNE